MYVLILMYEYNHAKYIWESAYTKNKLKYVKYLARDC